MNDAFLVMAVVPICRRSILSDSWGIVKYLRILLADSKPYSYYEIANKGR
jgi:hypothetical protein